MKFDFSKSNKSDLQNKISIPSEHIMMKNILYVTYVVDKILKKLNKMDTDNSLQTQVNEYFGSENNEDKEPD